MKIRHLLVGIVALSIVAGTAMLVMTALKFPDHSGLRQAMFGLSGTMTVLSVGAGVLFLRGRQDFKAGPRKAYALLCAGIIFVGISQIQFPLIEYFELRSVLTPFFGLIAVPYLLAVICTILGMRTLVRSVGMTTRWSSLYWLIGTATAAAILMMLLSNFLPHDRFDAKAFSAVQMNGAFGIWTATLYLLSARLAWQVRQILGPLYRRAMTWLFAGLVTVGCSALHLYAATRFFHDTWYEQDSVATIPLFIASILLLIAGYSTLAIRRRFEMATSSASGNILLDVVMYAANLASTPHDIDPALDTVRRITATSSGTRFTPAQEQELCQTYSAIEDHLVHREPLRPFDVAGLREQIVRKFNLPPDLQSRLWHNIS